MSTTEIEAAMDAPVSLHLFDGYGVELEYMIVDRQSLAVKPICDELLRAVSGEYTGEVEQGEACWSNELVNHLVELKTNGPVRQFHGVPDLMQRQIARINELLAARSAQLMPTAMHPWMDPATETQLWPHEYHEVYARFDRIFNCRRHGWANLQSVHLNLPFAGDEEFARLHAAVRLVLPLLPALAASSPLREGRTTGLLDTRLDAYRWHTWQVPSLVAQVIPEPVYTQADYEQQIFQRLYAGIAPFDPEAEMRKPWLNARGAIARFDRGAIEIRVLDVQECPAADAAICLLTAETVRGLVDERWAPHEVQKQWPVQPLFELLLSVARHGEQAIVADRGYLDLFGFPAGRAACTAGELWQHLNDQLVRGRATTPTWADDMLRVILERGPLARRILQSLNQDVSRGRIEAIYRELCNCLAEGRMFTGAQA